MLHKILIAFACLVCVANGFASWFAAEYCDTPLIAGEIIMNHEAEYSSERSVEIYRGDTKLINGSAYVPGEQLTAVLTGDDVGEMVFDSNKGIFEFGGCGDHRATASTSEITIPKDASGPIKVSAGWAYSHNTVYIASTFVLKPASAAIIDGAATSADAAEDSQNTVRFGVGTAESNQNYVNAAHQRSKYTQLLEQQQLYQLMENYMLFIFFIVIAAVIFILVYYKKKIFGIFQDDANLGKNY